ncbi:CvpA family protein [bacterium]|nr:CvpA family protein [bacterium]
MFDAILIIVWAIVTWCVAGEGAFGAALNCLIIILSGLLAMNLYEPAAGIGQSILGSAEWAYRWDVIALTGLFAAFVFGLRALFEKMTPRYFQMDGLGDDVGRWIFGALAGYITMAFLLTALHTAPLPRNFLGFTPERRNLFNIIAPDRQWLGFTQFVSENSLSRGIPRIFDGPVEDFIEPRNNEDHPNTVWPSFPVRYASRREVFAGTTQAVVPESVAPPVPSGPSSGAGAAGF